VQGDGAGDHRHIDVRPQRQLWVGNQYLSVEILTVALEARIFLDLEHDDDVAARTTTGTDVADTAHRHVLTSRDSSGDSHLNLLFSARPSLAPAFLARRGDDGPFAGTGRARRNTHHLPEEGALGAANLSRAVAGRARRRR